MYAGLLSTSLISQSRGLDVFGGCRCDIVYFVVLQVLSVGLIAMTLLEVRGGYLFWVLVFVVYRSWKWVTR